MPYNTKKIITDVTGRNPVPSYFNPDNDQYEPLFGQNGANRVLIWGANDQPLLTQENPGYFQLTGSRVEESIKRGIRQSNTEITWHDTPYGAKGAVIVLLAHGVTGTFNSDEGVRLHVWQRAHGSGSGLRNIFEITTDYTTTSARNHVITFSPFDLSKEDYAPVTLQNRHIKNHLFDVIGVRVDIKGTFQTDEGVDCEVTLQWIN